MKILETIWFIATIAIPVLAIIASIFSLWAIPWFLTGFWIVVGISIVLGFITGHLEFGAKYLGR